MTDVIREAFAALSADVDPLPSALRETPESVVSQLEAGGGAVAEAGTRLVGAVIWREEDGSLYVGRLAVPPSWRGRGIARALLATAEEEARRLGLPKLHLGTRLALEDNRRLFEGQGFVETTQHAHEGFLAPTWVRMEKRLAEAPPPMPPPTAPDSSAAR